MGKPPRVLIVADDLTGAMDSAGPFAAAGVDTWVAAAPMQCDPASLRAARVVSINTDSRHLPADQAAVRVREIAARLGAGYEVIFKKIDSTLRDNVVAETLALMESCGRKRGIVVPAFPAQGRTVAGGVVHVNGVPLAHTAFARDKLSPPPLAPLHEVFAPSVHAASVAADSPMLPAREEGVLVVDAGSDAELDRVVDALLPQLDEVVLAGSAGLTQALARRCFAGNATRASRGGVEGTILFAVGSRASQSAEQVEALSAEPGTRVLMAPNGWLPAGDPPAARNLVLKATPDEAGREGDAGQVAAEMAKHALDLARRARAEALVATGGDTAVAILSASGNPALQVLGDLMPGIPYARIRLDGTPVWLVTKAGGFGGRDTFREVAHKLRGAR